MRKVCKGCFSFFTSNREEQKFCSQKCYYTWNKGDNHSARGYKHTEETKKRLSKSKLGKKNPMYGKPVSEERKKKVSEFHSGKKRSLETRKKLSISAAKQMASQKTWGKSKWFTSSKTGLKEYSQSSYELERMKFLDDCDDVITWTKNHGIIIPYVIYGKDHNYVPDFLVHWKDDSVTLEEVKGYVKDQDILTAKNMAAVSYCEDHGMVFKLLNKADLQHKDRQRVFFLEGPDNCGKSHIGRSLEFLTGIPYFRFSKQHEYWSNDSFKLALEYDQPMLESLLKQLHCDVFVDRCYISEWVYSSVFKRDTNEKLLNKLDLYFSRLGCVAMIFLRRSYDEHDDDVVVGKNKFLELHEKYLEFVKWTRCRCIVMYVDDYDDDTLKQCPLLIRAMDDLSLSSNEKRIIEL